VFETATSDYHLQPRPYARTRRAKALQNLQDIGVPVQRLATLIGRSLPWEPANNSGLRSVANPADAVGKNKNWNLGVWPTPWFRGIARRVIPGQRRLSQQRRRSIRV
jgi:hypothetical protein